jgi:hypothetical protein
MTLPRYQKMHLVLFQPEIPQNAEDSWLVPGGVRGSFNWHLELTALILIAGPGPALYLWPCGCGRAEHYIRPDQA